MVFLSRWNCLDAVVKRQPVIKIAFLVPMVGAFLTKQSPRQSASSLLESPFSLDGHVHFTVDDTLANITSISGVGPPEGNDRSKQAPLNPISVHKVQKTLVFYPAALLLMATVVACLYYKKGFQVVLKIIVYLVSLSSMKLAVKFVFVEHHYRYPKSMTTMHLFFSALLGFSILCCRSTAVAIPNQRELAGCILPIAGAFAATLALNNMALTLCSASFTEIIGATSPIVTIGFVLVMGMPFHLPLLFPTCLVAFGCMMSAGGEVNFSLVGSLFCFGANIARSLRTSLQQKLMTEDTKHRFDPPAVLAWTCGASFLIMLLWSIITEGFAPWKILFRSCLSMKLRLPVALLGSCINACILNFAVLFVTKDLGAVGTQIIAQMKSIATVLGGVAFLGESLSYNEVVGFVLCLLGTGWFSHMQSTAVKLDEKPTIESTSTGVLGDFFGCKRHFPPKPEIKGPAPAG